MAVIYALNSFVSMPFSSQLYMQVPMKHQKGITVLDISYNLIQDIPRVRTGIP
jgi:hypothetical protein